jgi:hypothetical protein
MCAAPGGGADDGDLRDGRVDHPPLAEAVEQPLGDLERAAVRADVLAEEKTLSSRAISSAIPSRMASR